MTQNTRQKEGALSDAPTSKDAKDQALYFNTITLSRFMRACYGPEAAKEAQRHFQQYTSIKQPDIAEIWKRVVAHINGIELKDPQRLVKSINSE